MSNNFVTVRDIGYSEKIWGYLPDSEGYLPVGLHCKIVLFPDHTACTDPGNIVGGSGGGGGVQAHPPQVFFSHQLNLRFFSKKTIIFQDAREGPTFTGGVGGWGSNLTRGGGGSNLTRGRGSKYKIPNNL